MVKVRVSVGIMICLTSVEYRRSTISAGAQTTIIPVVLTMSRPRTSHLSFHCNMEALSFTLTVLYPWVPTRRFTSLCSEASLFCK